MKPILQKAARTLQKLRGDQGEDAALVYLQQQGLRLLERNWRCKAGEIDLIMQDDATLVFVEVRRRKNDRFGGAAASVTWHKQQKLIRAAQWYLQQAGAEPACRFDVLAWQDDVAQPDWQRNAFELS
ncbi:YraN family protein [Ampullimonas aquatilis]|uniref:YraN family protein n=1 Tax=Ampullimonas aquatilis TaxID=1341549 RepID=UPI003C742698